MDNKTIKITPQGLKALQDELKDLKGNKLPTVVKRVATAREFGDLSENAEYHAAREDHAWIQGRIEEIEDILNRSEVFETNDDGTVGLGSQVIILTDNGKEMEYHIVGDWEADPMAKKISAESPLGKALVGRKTGDHVEFEAPAGKVHYTVKNVK